METYILLNFMNRCYNTFVILLTTLRNEIKSCYRYF